MFTRKERFGKFIGYELTRAGRTYFFGSRYLPRAALTEYFPQYEFAFLKQVHGRLAVEADPRQTIEADAHFTDRRSVALVSQTADCVPILLVGTHKVSAIHSGWRGCAQNIVAATAQALKGDRVLVAAIGPHILAPSFEIGRDVIPQLMAGAPAGSSESDFVLEHTDPAKAYFDLTALVRRQLLAAFGEKLEILECLEDTKTSIQFHSFRRDRAEAGRQYSFVVING